MLECIPLSVYGRQCVCTGARILCVYIYAYVHAVGSTETVAGENITKYINFTINIPRL